MSYEKPAKREDRVDVSIVIPLLNEAESLPELYQRIVAALEEAGVSFEVPLRR